MGVGWGCGWVVGQGVGTFFSWLGGGLRDGNPSFTVM